VGPRVLIVNDNDDGLFLLRHAVAKEAPDAVLLECKGANLALTLLESQPVDAIITDNRMPDMSGIAMVRAIRLHDPTTPILMITGSPEAEAEALAAGVTIFVGGGTWDEIRGKIRALILN